MDQKQIQEKIAEYYKKLTPKMQEVFSKMEWLDNLRGISLRYNMTDEQIQTLGTETSLVMLGIIHPDEYEQNLMTELAVPRDIGLKIIDDINLEILNEWRGELIETFSKNTKDIADKTYGKGKTLDERWSNLPKEVQDAINSINYQNTLVEISQENNLNLSQMNDLDMITAQMMLGTIHPEDYNAKLFQALNMPKEKVDMIYSEVSEKILKSIRTKLVEHAESIKKTEQVEPQVPVPPYKKMETPAAPIISNNYPAIMPIEIKAANPLPASQNNNLEATKNIETQNIPNYTAINVPEALVSVPFNKENILSTAGIDIIHENQILQKDTSEKISNKEENSLSQSGIDIISKNLTKDTSIVSNRKETLEGIENPQIVPKNIMSAKLGGIVSSNIGSGSAPHTEDKYRETI